MSSSDDSSITSKVSELPYKFFTVGRLLSSWRENPRLSVAELLLYTREFEDFNAAALSRFDVIFGSRLGASSFVQQADAWKKIELLVRNQWKSPEMDEASWQTLYEKISVSDVTKLLRGKTVGPTHSNDYRSVSWYDTHYSFTGNQAACIKMLWAAWEQNTPDVGGDTLLEGADVSMNAQRLDRVFRGHPAWGVMIASGGTKGSYRLQHPSEAAPKKNPPKAPPKKKSARGAKRRA
jgi:hypothetical protein